MYEEKNWYNSRTIWVNLVAGIFALLAVIGFTPENISQEETVAAIMAIISAINILLRFFTDKPIA